MAFSSSYLKMFHSLEDQYSAIVRSQPQFLISFLLSSNHQTLSCPNPKKTSRSFHRTPTQSICPDKNEELRSLDSRPTLSMDLLLTTRSPKRMLWRRNLICYGA